VIEFHYGDIVVLKSGGPPMTVDILPGDQISSYSPETWTTYGCVWFRGAHMERGHFEEHLLKKFESPKG